MVAGRALHDDAGIIAQSPKMGYHMTDSRTTGPLGVIFDLDGTLVDTLDDITDAINAVFARRGLAAVTRERIRDLIGEGLANLLQRASGIDDAFEVAALVSEYRPEYRARLLANTRLYGGIDAVLDGLVEARRPFCVLSNKHHEFTAPICAALLARWPVAAVRGFAEGAARKPDPTVALELASLMGVAVGRVAFVGDSSIDVETARAAGMVAVAVTWGYRSLAHVHATGADFVVGTPTELMAVLCAP